MSDTKMLKGGTAIKIHSHLHIIILYYYTVLYHILLFYFDPLQVMRFHSILKLFRARLYTCTFPYTSTAHDQYCMVQYCIVVESSKSLVCITRYTYMQDIASCRNKIENNYSPAALETSKYTQAFVFIAPYTSLCTGRARAW